MKIYKRTSIIFFLLLFTIGILLSACKNDYGYCSINFDLNNGKTYDEIIIKKGEKIIEPIVPINGTDKFEYWSTDKEGNNKWDFNNIVKKDIILYANYDKIYIVSYYINNILLRSLRVKSGEKIKKYDLSYNGVISNWYFNPEMTQLLDDDFLVDKNISIYSKIEPKSEWIFSKDSEQNNGWKICQDSIIKNGNKLTILDECIKLNFESPGEWDTYLKSPEIDLTNLQSYNSIQIIYKNISAINNLRIFYTTDLAKDWNGARGENFQVLRTSMTENDNWEILNIKISETNVLKNQWNGTLIFLRFEFSDTSSPKPNVAEEIYIKKISLIK